MEEGYDLLEMCSYRFPRRQFNDAGQTLLILPGGTGGFIGFGYGQVGHMQDTLCVFLYNSAALRPFFH